MSYAYQSGRSLSGIRDSLSKLNESVFSTKKSAQSISSSLKKSNLIKKRSIADSSKFFQMRRDSVRKREREDLVEASTSGGSFKRASQSPLKSTKGFFGRIMDYLGNVLIGWAVVNLPRIIDQADGLSKRLQKYFGVISEFFNSSIQLFTDLGSGVGLIFNSVKNLNFSGFQTVINDSLGKMNTSFQRMLLSTEQGLNMLLDSSDGLLKRAGFDISNLNVTNLFGQDGPDKSSDGSVRVTTDNTTYPVDSKGNPVVPQSDGSKDKVSDTQSDGSKDKASDTTTYPLDDRGKPITPITNISDKLINLVPTENLMSPNVGDGPVGMSTKYGFSQYHGRHHAGIDIGTSGQKGYHVSFGGTGTVVFVGNLSGYGKTVIINSGGLDFLFAHLANYDVNQGEKYTGQIIGEIGNTGRSSGIHLHFEVRKKDGAAGSDVDPMPHVSKLNIGKVNPNPTQIDKTSKTPDLNLPTNQQNESDSGQFDIDNPMLKNIFRNFQGSDNQSKIDVISQPPTKRIASSNIIINNSGGGSAQSQPSDNEGSTGSISFDIASVNSSNAAAKLFDLQQLNKLG